MTHKRHVRAWRLRSILDQLLDHDMTREQLAAALHVTRPQSLCTYLDELVEQRQVHVSRWTEPAANGVRWAIYRWGKGYNRARPRRKSHAQVMRDYRAK